MQLEPDDEKPNPTHLRDVRTVRRVAAMVLDDDVDKAIFRRHVLERSPLRDLVEETGLSKSSVYNRYNSIVERLARAVAAEVAWYAENPEVAPTLPVERDSEDPVMIADARSLVPLWFSVTTRPGYASRFGPLAVLLAAWAMADNERSVRFSRLHEVMPRAAVAAAMQTLKALRYVDTDGVTLTIRRTPLEEVLS